MTCSCCASRPLERGRRELRAAASHCERPVSRLHRLAWAQLWPPVRGSVLRAPRTGCRVCTVFSSNHRANVWFHSSALAPGQSAASPTADLHLDYLTVVVRTRSLTIICPGAATGKQGDAHFDMSFHGEARCSRLCVTTPLPEPGQQLNCCGENMSFRGILISNNSLT